MNMSETNISLIAQVNFFEQLWAGGEVSFLTFGRSAQLYRRCRCSVALYCSPSWCDTLCSNVLNFVQKWGLHTITVTDVLSQGLKYLIVLQSNFRFWMWILQRQFYIRQFSQLCCWCRCSVVLYCSSSWCATLWKREF